MDLVLAMVLAMVLALDLEMDQVLGMDSAKGVVEEEEEFVEGCSHKQGTCNQC